MSQIKVAIFALTRLRSLLKDKDKIVASSKVLRKKSKTGENKFNRTAQAKFLAESLVGYVHGQVEKDLLRLSRKSPFTMYAMPSYKTNKTTYPEQPMYWTGQLLSHLKVRKSRGASYIVYWEDAVIQVPKGSYGKSTMTVYGLIDMNRKKRSYSNKAGAGKKRARWQAIAIRKAQESGRLGNSGVEWSGGRKGFTTYRARPFWDRAVAKFKKKHSKGNIRIELMDKKVLIRVM